MNSSNILITGGSGFIGSHFHNIIPHHQIINFDLNEPEFEYDSNFVKGDIRNFNKLDEALLSNPCDTIISLAAEHKDFGITKEQYFKTNEFGTEVVCKVATKHNIKNIIFYSSVAVYGDNTSPSHEEMTPSPSNHYGASKLAGEEVLKEWAAEDVDRSVLIIRPVVVYGERNIANMYRLIDQIQKGRYFHIGKGENIKSIAYVKNLVDGTLFLKNKIGAGVHIYNYSDEPQLSSRSIANVIANTIGNKKLITLPYSLVYLMGLPFDFLIWMTKKDLPISTNRVKKFCTETFHTAKKIRTEGFQSKFTNQEGLERMVKWYKIGEKEIEKELIEVE